ncbi:putative DsbA family dithiol-disulfide isomerase [Rubricella aquisinus]|uniref:Putative DsbA family dithiol-disulfide isomerase n=1 Tax=Rubricella aquisinus TaxID=2028108 RepID=A0A840WJU6_9RHOB|nr:DsbA family oxidoreductase [Rubricella aquisinus]MBB5514801.1 putative DsbA family dithiol-disulfide isomerase [Rubricella aquisinus]
MITLDILSDPICPWCYIGKHRLEKAMAAAGVNPFEITWRPFQLNPDMPAEGVDRTAYLETKFGKKRAAGFYAQIEETAKADGLDVDFAAIKRTPNTIDAHRVIRWAAQAGHQTPLVQELFERYFTRGQDISDHAVLSDAAEIAGLDRDVIVRALSTDADRDAVIDEDKQARTMGVNSVPTFIVAGRHVVNGAQPPELWERVIQDILSLDGTKGTA